MIAAGSLRHRVVMQSPQASQDAQTGALTTAWHDEATVWAAIEPVSVRDFMQSAAGQSEVTARIVIRYRTDVLPSWRVLHGSRIYEISGVLPDKDTGLDYLTLACRSGVNQG